MKKLVLALNFALLTSSVMAQDKHGAIKIYDAKFVPGIFSLFEKGKLVIDDSVHLKKKNMPKDAIYLHDNLIMVRNYFLRKFNRNSYDNKGSDITASVNVNKFAFPDILGQKQNAAWMSTRFSFGAGKAKGLDDFAAALDVVGHEFTHAVIESTSNLNYENQSGALNEHFADVFGALINQEFNKPANPFLMGASILRGKHLEKADALRDMMNPSKSLKPQPSHMNDLKQDQFKKYVENCKPGLKNDYCGVHVLSGIPNRAAALIMSKISWEDSAQLFYIVMTQKLSRNSNFADYAKALKKECFTFGPQTCVVVDESLKAVGL